jgi:hypothetical protein
MDIGHVHGPVGIKVISYFCGCFYNTPCAIHFFKKLYIVRPFYHQWETVTHVYIKDVALLSDQNAPWCGRLLLYAVRSLDKYMISMGLSDYGSISCFEAFRTFQNLEKVNSAFTVPVLSITVMYWFFYKIKWSR